MIQIVITKRRTERTVEMWVVSLKMIRGRRGGGGGKWFQNLVERGEVRGKAIVKRRMSRNLHVPEAEVSNEHVRSCRSAGERVP